MKQLFLVLSISVVAIFTALGYASPVAAACGDTYVLGIPAWYNHLPLQDKNGACEVNMPVSNGRADVVKMAAIIGMNVVQALLVISAYFAVFYIIKGGFNYIYGSGSPESMQSAKNTIKNAVIGIIIAGMSAAIVNAVAGLIK